MEKFAAYDKFGMKEYKETFIVGGGILSSFVVAFGEVGSERLEIVYPQCWQDGRFVLLY